ncbi:MAG: hypothetical protein HKN23_14115 [Verrucomicrobiales bacterium]|nr:hypothetical protein [Verrucomicrobiales bacterium]
MKTRSVVCVLLVFGSFAASTAMAQIVVPGTPNKFKKRDLSGNTSTGATIVKREQPKPKTITYTAVSPIRLWTNKEGKVMKGRLLAFSAPTDPKLGPTEIIRDGKIRLLVDQAKAPTDYPLEKLAQADQIFVRSIAQAAQRPPEKTKPAVPIEKPEAPK